MYQRMSRNWENSSSMLWCIYFMLTTTNRSHCVILAQLFWLFNKWTCAITSFSKQYSSCYSKLINETFWKFSKPKQEKKFQQWIFKNWMSLKIFSLLGLFHTVSLLDRLVVSLSDFLACLPVPNFDKKRLLTGCYLLLAPVLALSTFCKHRNINMRSSFRNNFITLSSSAEPERFFPSLLLEILFSFCYPQEMTSDLVSFPKK